MSKWIKRFRLKKKKWKNTKGTVTFQKSINNVTFDFDPFCFGETLLLIILTKVAQKMCIMCTNGCSLTSLKQLLNFTQQKSVEYITISCEVTFGFKYIFFQ